MAYARLLQRIKKRRARVGIIGMGYVGLPLLQTFCRAGYECLGFDVDERKVTLLNRGRSYIKHIPSESIRELRTARRFSASRDPQELKRCDALLICVPTPLTPSREPDMQYVE